MFICTYGAQVGESIAVLSHFCNASNATIIMMKQVLAFPALSVFTLGYLGFGAFAFLGTGNAEFVIYVLVIAVIFSGTLLLHAVVKFPIWMLWLLSVWGLMHILGGAVQIGDHVLFAHRIYPFVDLGGEFYILKYDQVVHGYLYGLVTLMAHHAVAQYYRLLHRGWMLAMIAILVSVGISGLNEIMEFFISISVENGVGGYENTMLDMCFNLGGAIIAMSMYTFGANVRDCPDGF